MGELNNQKFCYPYLFDIDYEGNNTSTFLEESEV